MKLSIVIPTSNRADFLKETLDSILAQDLSQEYFEVIVVDNRSSDHTRQVVESFNCLFRHFQYFFEEKEGLVFARNLGLKVSKGEILVYCDDDIVATTSWLSSILDAFENKTVGLVGGNNLPLFLSEPPKWLLSIWYRGLWRGYQSIPSLSIIKFFGPKRRISPYKVWGCNFAVRKSILLDAKGFHPDGFPANLIMLRGDGETYVSDFISRSKFQCIFHPGASIFHKVTPDRMTFEYFYKRGFAQGISDSYSMYRSEKGERIIEGIGILFLLKRLLIKIYHSFNTKEVNKALKELERGRLEGFNHHRERLALDQDLRQWVLKNNYLD